MADELTLSLLFHFLKSGSLAEWTELDQRFTVAGTKPHRSRQVIGTSAEPIELGDAGVGGYLMCKNHDADNFVQLNANGGAVWLARLEPGDIALFRIDDGATPNAKADTASCEVEFLILEA